MPSIVIVAIPEQDDMVWDISSEKVPHMTLCYLGDSAIPPLESQQIVSFVEHMASTVIDRFWLDVDKRGPLGPDNADVLFFEGWDLPEIKRARDHLLQNDTIKKYYLSTTQYPEWTPHLTLGYPETPAKELKNGERIWSVRFDRIAVWFGDSEGPTFDLKKPEPVELMMSTGSDAVQNMLKHYGVKGMKWGRRKADNTPSGTVATTTGVSKSGKATISVKGGKGFQPHPDAVRAQELKTTFKKSGSHALSNKDLQDLQTRLNLEQNVSRLADPQGETPKEFINKLLVNIAKQQVTKIANDVAAKQVASAMDKKK